MSTSIAVVACNTSTRERLVGLIPAAAFSITAFPPPSPDAPLPATPQLFVLALPGLETPEEQLIERLRADEATANIPIVLASALPMIDLQSVPYASDWTIAIVEEPVKADILLDTMQFLLNPEG